MNRAPEERDGRAGACSSACGDVCLGEGFPERGFDLLLAHPVVEVVRCELLRLLLFRTSL